MNPAAVNLATELPGGRTVGLDVSVAEGLCAGVVMVTDVTIAEVAAVWAALDEMAEQWRAEYGGTKPGQITPLQEARRLYRSFGMEPTRHRPSSEALLRRVLKDKPLYHINNAVDVCNLASLTFLLPIGMYDLERIAGDVVLRLGREGEQYAGIRKGDVHLQGRLGLFDAEGGFGSPTSDSTRTCVGESTRQLLAVVMATADYRQAAMAAHCDLLGSLFARHCGGRLQHQSVLGGQA